MKKIAMLLCCIILSALFGCAGQDAEAQIFTLDDADDYCINLIAQNGEALQELSLLFIEYGQSEYLIDYTEASETGLYLADGETQVSKDSALGKAFMTYTADNGELKFSSVKIATDRFGDKAACFMLDLRCLDEEGALLEGEAFISLGSRHDPQLYSEDYYYGMTGMIRPMFDWRFEAIFSREMFEVMQSGKGTSQERAHVADVVVTEEPEQWEPLVYTNDEYAVSFTINQPNWEAVVTIYGKIEVKPSDYYGDMCIWITPTAITGDAQEILDERYGQDYGLFLRDNDDAVHNLAQKHTLIGSRCFTRLSWDWVDEGGTLFGHNVLVYWYGDDYCYDLYATCQTGYEGNLDSAVDDIIKSFKAGSGT